MPFRPGEHLGDYEILRLLGAGGMGEVYQVRNMISDRVEALKVLPGPLQANKDLQERFLREIKISAALRHPHIAELRTAQRVDGLLVMVMEFVDGVTLDFLTRNGPLPLKNALHYTRQVLDALGFAHARHVVHRDIKPQNVMVTEGDSVRLMDFGIARSLGDQSLTMTGMTLGSLFYMSPEQIRGEEVDARSDLYSMGVLLYEMATGQRPFQGTSGYTVMAAHLEKAPPPPVERNPELPPALNNLILKALEKDPALRYQCAAEFGEAVVALDRELHGRLDGLILTRAFEVKAAELPSEALTLAARQNSVTQTMPNTPTPGSGRPQLPGQMPSSAPTFGAPAEPSKTSPTNQTLAMVFLLIGLVAVAGIFGPNLLRELRGGAASEGKTGGEQVADTEQSAGTDQTPGTQPESGAPGAGAPSGKPAPTADPATESGAATASAQFPRPPAAPEPAVAPSGALVGNPSGQTGERPNPGEPPPPGGGRLPPEVEAEMRQTIQQVEADLKAAGIDMKLYGPDAREGRRFAALERAQQFSDVARRFGAVVKRRTDLEKERQEMGRRPMAEANRRLRGRMLNEMGNHWREVSEATGAAEAAIKSQNLTLAAEKLTLAEKELDAIETMMASMRARAGQTGN